MKPVTNEEWDIIVGALVHGGLRETIDDIIQTRLPSEEVSEENRRLLASAFVKQGEDGGRFRLATCEKRFTGWYEDEIVVEGVEIDGTLYTIFHIGDWVELFVGDTVLGDEPGRRFNSARDAWAHIGEIA